MIEEETYTEEEIFEEVEAPSVEEIEQELLENGKWKEEAKQIPLEMVTPKEAYIISLYIHDELSSDDEEELKEILERYRPAIIKHDPIGTLENVETNLEYNNAEKGFLEILQQQSHEKTLTMNYPLDDGSTYELKLKIKESDSQSITDLQTNFKLFEDLTEKEDMVRFKQQQGQQLTREEQIILQGINKKIEEKVMSNQYEMMIEFLATHTTIINEEHDYNYMKAVYQTMEKQYMEQLFARVSKISGLINQEADDLFQ